MSERKGIDKPAMDSMKLPSNKIPKLSDFLSEFSAIRGQFCNKKENIPQLVLVINTPDGSRSLSSSNGTVSKKIL